MVAVSLSALSVGAGDCSQIDRYRVRALLTEPDITAAPVVALIVLIAVWFTSQWATAKLESTYSTVTAAFGFAPLCAS
jgi:hypothetical protein